MNWLVIYNLNTLQVEHYISCSSKMPTLADFGMPLELGWGSLELIDPPFEISRDHKLVQLGDDVVGSEPSVNPIQPTLEPVVDWKKEWDNATSLGEQIRVLARKQGLE